MTILDQPLIDEHGTEAGVAAAWIDAERRHRDVTDRLYAALDDGDDDLADEYFAALDEAWAALVAARPWTVWLDPRTEQLRWVRAGGTGPGSGWIDVTELHDLAEGPPPGAEIV